MRKYLVLAVLGIVAAFGLNTATASAATSCTIHWDPIYFSGTTLQSVFHASPCTNVDMIQFQNVVNNQCSGMYDVSTNQGYCATAPTLFSVTCGRQYITFTGDCSYVVHRTPWCPIPQTSHVVYGTAWVRVHQKSPQIGWGVWTPEYTTNQAIWC